MTTIWRKSPLTGLDGVAVIRFGGWEMSFSPLENGFEPGRPGLIMVDYSNRTKILIEGQKADAVVGAALAGQELPVEAGLDAGGDRFVYRLRLDQFYIDGPPEGEAEMVSALEAAAAGVEGLVTVTNQADGRAVLGLIGGGSRDCLSQLCALNLADKSFPNHAARQSSVAKTRQLIIRRDIDGRLGFLLSGGRSLAVYLWQAIGQAGA